MALHNNQCQRSRIRFWILAVIGPAFLISRIPTQVPIAWADSFNAGESRLWEEFFCIDGEICGVGDFDEDGRDDIIRFVRSSNADQGGDVYVALSTGSTFVGTGKQWAEYFCVEEEVFVVGNCNGDGADDVIAFVRSSQNDDDDDAEGDVYVALAEAGKFGDPEMWDDFFIP